MALGDFLKVFPVTIAYEGWRQYSDNPHDPGAGTYSGVTQHVWDAWCAENRITRCSVRRMTDDQCREIYKRQYYDAVQGDRLPKGLVACVYDEAVNSGPVVAIKALQKVLGEKQDGHLGLATFAALARKSNQVPALIDTYDANRLSFMHRLRNWTWFGKGWTARVRNLTTVAKKLAAAP